MSHSAALGDIEVPLTWSPQEAVAMIQEAGIIGAGGGGFPTHLKYQQAPHTLLVNACESEPGYYADKLLLRDEPEALIDLFDFMSRALSIEEIVIGAESVARPYMKQLESLERIHGGFHIAYVEPKYKFGEERALCKAALGKQVPKGAIPPNIGVVVNNNETLFHVYRAEFEERPQTTKFLQVYGEIGAPQVYEAPVGTLAADLLDIYGAKPSEYAKLQLFDGGPILSTKVADPMGEEPMFPVARNTNALLVAHPDRTPKKGHYPSPDYEHNTDDAPWAADTIHNIEAQVDRVRVPLTGGHWKHGNLLVKEGDEVIVGDHLTAIDSDPLSVGVHASIPGRITKITDEYVEIHRT